MLAFQRTHPSQECFSTPDKQLNNEKAAAQSEFTFNPMAGCSSSHEDDERRKAECLDATLGDLDRIAHGDQGRLGRLSEHTSVSFAANKVSGVGEQIIFTGGCPGMCNPSLPKVETGRKFSRSAERRCRRDNYMTDSFIRQHPGSGSIIVCDDNHDRIDAEETHAASCD